MTTKRYRNPNFPGIDLLEAVKALKLIYSQQAEQTFSAADAARSWGYKGQSGPAGVKFAALRQYGLVDRQPGGTYKLSELGLKLVSEPLPIDGIQAIRESALKPDLFKDLYIGLTSGTAGSADRNPAGQNTTNDD